MAVSTEDDAWLQTDVCVLTASLAPSAKEVMSATLQDLHHTLSVTALPAEVGWFSNPHMLLFGEKCGQMLNWCWFYD